MDFDYARRRQFEPLEKIYERLKDTGVNFKELETHLDNMAKKGLIHFKKEDGKKYFFSYEKKDNGWNIREAFEYGPNYLPGLGRLIR